MNNKYEDLTGQKFGKLTVIKRGDDYISPKGKRHVRWLCKCDCGSSELKIVLAHRLKSGHTKSCGCLNKDTSKKYSVKKYNTYNLNGDYGIGYTFKGEEFYFDLEDYDKIKNYCWYMNKSGYILTSVNEKNIRFHRLIMGVTDDKTIVDHKNHLTNDNRKSNLRLGTYSNNSMNRIPKKEDRIPGVSFEKQTNKWVANIMVDHKQIKLGRFDDYDDAVEVRKEAEEKYFREWSYSKSLNNSNSGELSHLIISYGGQK